MPEREPKLGDVIDDYCSHCKLIMNHGIVGVVEAEIKRVRCNTCLNEHAYRQGRIPRKKDKVKELFDQVLSNMPAPPTGPAKPKEPVQRQRRSLHLGLRPRQPPPEEPPAKDRRRKRRRRPGGGRRRRGGKGGGGGRGRR